MNDINPIVFRPIPDRIAMDNFDEYDSMFLIGYFYSQYASMGRVEELAEDERIASLHDVVRSMILAGGRESDVIDYVNVLLEKISSAVLHNNDGKELNLTLLLFTEVCLLSSQLSRDLSSREIALEAIQKVSMIPDCCSVIEPETLSDLAVLCRAWKLSMEDPFNLSITTLENCGTVSAALLLGDAVLAESRISDSLEACLAFESSPLLVKGGRFLSRVRIYKSFFDGFDLCGFLYVASKCGFNIELKDDAVSRFIWADCNPNGTHRKNT